MPTYVSIVDWSHCSAAPSAEDVQASIEAARPFLARAGFHSLRPLGEGAERSAIVIATCEDEASVARLAQRIVPGIDARIESMRFDDAPAAATWTRGEHPRPRRRLAYQRRLLRAISGA